MTVESTEMAQVEEPMTSTGAEDNTLQTLMAEPSTVESVLLVVVSEAVTITIPEVPVMTSVLTEPAAGLVSAPSEMAFAFTDIVRTIIEGGPGVHQQSWLQP